MKTARIQVSDNDPTGLALRRRLRRILPRSIVTLLRRAETYLKRLRIWARIPEHVLGVEAADRARLRMSMSRAPITAARSLDKWADPVLLDDARVDVRRVGRFELRARSDDLWHVLPFREPALFNTIRLSLRPGDTFVDAGANIGFYTVMAARIVGPAGRVIAFEMMPDTAAILRRHIEMNDLSNVEVVERALSDRPGDTIHAHVVEGKFGQATISGKTAGTRVSVETTTLDAALRHVPSIRLMKMDIEGVEELALRGAQDVLERIENIVFESWGPATPIDNLLAARGFSVRALDKRNRIACKF